MPSELEKLLSTLNREELAEYLIKTKNMNENLDMYINFANWNVKYTNLESAKKYLEYKNLKPDTVLDLASGKGNDLNRYDKLRIEKIIGIELDIVQFREAIIRYNKYKNNIYQNNKKYSKNRKPISVQYINGSMTDYKLVRSSLRNSCINLVVNNFSMNYVFSDISKLNEFLKGISDSLRIGSLFVGTCTDGDILESNFKWSAKKQINTELYSVVKIGKWSGKEFGKKYKFKLETPYFKNAPVSLTTNRDHKTDTNYIEEYIINKKILVKYAKIFNLVPFSIIDGIEPLCNLANYPIAYDEFSKKYYDRPVDLSSLYFSFTFIKISDNTKNDINKPSGLIIVLYKDTYEDIDIKQKHVYCKYSELKDSIDKFKEYNYFVLNDIDRIPDYSKFTIEYPVSQIIYKNGTKLRPPRYVKRYINSRQFDEQSFILQINKSDLSEILGKSKHITKFEDLLNKETSYVYRNIDIKCIMPAVAIIVPYRAQQDISPENPDKTKYSAIDRKKHLDQFIKYMTKFMSSLDIVYEIIIVEQSFDSRKFNRGKLLNIGFDICKKSEKKFDTFIFHDVDLLPTDSIKYLYRQFAKNPIHIAKCWDRYSDDPNYFGGIVAFNEEQFIKINGFTNLLYGWGYEDMLQKKALDKLKIKVDVPACSKFDIKDLEYLNLKDKLALLKKNTNYKANLRYEIAAFIDKSEIYSYGLKDITYEILDTNKLDENCIKYTLDILLNYDKSGKMIDIDYEILNT